MNNTRLQLSIIALAIGTAASLQAQGEELSRYSGAQLYERFCSSCHGDRGLGDGPVAPFFKLKVPDLTRIAVRHGGEFPTEQVRRIIDGRDVRAPHGARQMPVWGWELRAADTDQPRESADDLITRLVEYVRSIQRR